MENQPTNEPNGFAFLIGCWRQPIPTNLDVVFGEDYRCQRLYELLILRACNKETATIRFDNVLVHIKRGQVIYGRNKYAVYLQWSPSTVDRTLARLQGTYHLVNNLRTDNFTIVTLQNYEEVIKMNNPRTTDDQPMNTSKSIETKKNVNNRYVKPPEQSIPYKNQEGLQEYQNMKKAILGGKFGP